MFNTMTRYEFDTKVKNAKAGARIVYHVGDLAYDRQLGFDFLKVNAVGLAAFQACEAGKVDLIQKLLAPGVFEYIAIKKTEPHTKVGWTGCYDPSRTSYVNSVVENA